MVLLQKMKGHGINIVIVIPLSNSLNVVHNSFVFLSYSFRYLIISCIIVYTDKMLLGHIRVQGSMHIVIPTCRY